LADKAAKPERAVVRIGSEQASSANKARCLTRNISAAKNAKYAKGAHVHSKPMAFFAFFAAEFVLFEV
jgi:hypothetical protein